MKFLDGKEVTWRALLLAIVMAIVFGAANVYLALKVGMTVSASIPAACISMAIFATVMSKTSILENNMVQTVASAGESLAAGVAFTVPALLLMGGEFNWFSTFMLALAGGFLGVLFMVPLRKLLIEDEDKNLPYPEGRACASVLQAPSKGMGAVWKVLAGIIIGIVVKLLVDGGFGLINEFPMWKLPFGKGFVVSFDVLPALVAVGFIIGFRISAMMLAGAALGWWVIIPLFAAAPEIFSKIGVKVVGEIKDIFVVQKNILRYIGAGAVAASGILGVIKTLPAIISSIRKAISGGFTGSKRDLSLKVVGLIASLIALSIALFPELYGIKVQMWISILIAAFVVILSFLFVAVSSRIVGLVGSSSNPISGMTIATLVITSLVFVKVGIKEPVTVMLIGAFVCIAMAIAGDTSQDLKTGYLVGATPFRQQIGELIGVLASSLFVGFSLYMLYKAYGFGSKQLSAPQAVTMKLLVEGLVTGNAPYQLLIIGVFVALMFELLGMSALPIAIGLYLPLELSMSVMVGGLARWIFDNYIKGDLEDSTLIASGLIAGEALTGIILAVLAISGISLEVAKKLPDTVSLIVLVTIALIIMFPNLIVPSNKDSSPQIKE